MFDVFGAFEFVPHHGLLHNPNKRRIDHRLICWIRSFLKDKTTAFRSEDFTSYTSNTSTGVLQGSPLSLILYLFCNANLLEDCLNQTANTVPIGYINDTGILIRSSPAEKNRRNLAEIHKKCMK